MINKCDFCRGDEGQPVQHIKKFFVKPTTGCISLNKAKSKRVCEIMIKRRYMDEKIFVGEMKDN